MIKLLNKYKLIDKERFFKDVFEKEEYLPCRELKADVILDIGALAGEFSAYMYDKAKVIYAIEPYSKHYVELEENIKEFGLTKIKSFRLALSNSNGSADLSILQRGGHTLVPSVTPSEIEQVPCQTLATFIKEQKIEHIDILKIDIENGELLVFNSPDFKEVADRIDVIIGEHLGGLEELFKSLGFTPRGYKQNTIFERL